MAVYIHERYNWTDFQWEDEKILNLLSEVRHLQGKLIGKVELLGFKLKDEANLETLIQDVVQSSKIEGEILNPEQVRSSIATRLGLENLGLVIALLNINASIYYHWVKQGILVPRIVGSRHFYTDEDLKRGWVEENIRKGKR